MRFERRPQIARDGGVERNKQAQETLQTLNLPTWISKLGPQMLIMFFKYQLGWLSFWSHRDWKLEPTWFLLLREWRRLSEAGQEARGLRGDLQRHGLVQAQDGRAADSETRATCGLLCLLGCWVLWLLVLWLYFCWFFALVVHSIF